MQKCIFDQYFHRIYTYESNKFIRIYTCGGNHVSKRSTLKVIDSQSFISFIKSCPKFQTLFVTSGTTSQDKRAEKIQSIT